MPKKFTRMAKIVLAGLILVSNTAFKRGDQIQLKTDLNGRESLNFTRSGKVRFIVKAGTIASVMDYRRLKSGNAGVLVRLDGPAYSSLPEAERTVWLYDWRNRTDDLKACGDQDCKTEAASIEAASWARAEIDQPGTTLPPEPLAADEKPVIEIATPPPVAVQNTTAADTNTCQGWECTVRTQDEPAETIQNLERALPDGRLTYSGGALLAPRCHKFIDNQGNVGPWGEKVIRTMLQAKYNVNGENLFLRDKTLSRVVNGRRVGLCPGYHKMSDEQKKKTLVTMWAALAQKESSCDPVNNHMALVSAAGLFSAERSAALRHKRGSACRGDIYDINVQITCAIDTEASYGYSLADGRSLMESQYFEPLKKWNSYRIRNHRTGQSLRYTPILEYMKRIKQCEI